MLRQPKYLSFALILSLLMGAFVPQPVRSASIANTEPAAKSMHFGKAAKATKGEAHTIQPGQIPEGPVPSPVEGLSATEWENIQDAISADQHAFSTNGDTATAYNSTQNWELTFDENGLSVSPSPYEGDGRGGGQSWAWGLTLTGYGYDPGDFPGDSQTSEV